MFNLNLKLFLNSYKSLPFKFKAIFFQIYFLSLVMIVLESFSISLIVPLVSHLSGGEGTDNFFFSRILDIIEKFNYLGANYLNFKNYGTNLIFSILIIYLIKFILNLFQVYLNSKFVHGVKYVLTNKALRYYLSRDYNFHLKSNSSFLIRNIVNETSNFSLGYFGSITAIITDITIVIALVSLAIISSPTISSIIIVLILFIAIIFYKFIKVRAIEFGKIRFKSEGYILKNIKEALISIVEIKLMNAYEVILNTFKLNNKKLYSVNVLFSIYQSLPKIFFEIVFIISVFSVFLLTEIMNNDYNKILPILSIYVVVSLRVIPSITKIIISLQQINFNSKTIKTIHNFINKKENDFSQAVFQKSLNLNNYLHFKNLSYAYLKNKKKSLKIFNKINLRISLNEKIGIYGTSGSGKSTFLKLIAGLLHPDSGTITIDRIKLTKKNIRSWQNQIGFLTQNTFLLDDKISKNIAFGQKNIDYHLIEKLLKITNLKKFLNHKGEINDKVVGDFGQQISGGERQRIALCRVLYRKPKIIILDEPTSSLDKENEEKILKTIFKLKNITIFLVSHNKESFKYCDKLYEIKNGILIKK
jgi:ABC-type bacteriocin/lantibiotic exporter with double-glycine peptidase domain